MTADDASPPYTTQPRLLEELRGLGVSDGDGLFVHASLSAMGLVVGGARSVVSALIGAVGADGTVAMPGFSADAYFPDLPADVTPSAAARREIEDAVPGFDRDRSPTQRMGAIAECFRTWPGVRRSAHPTSSICAYGPDAQALTAAHPYAWATGPDSPLGAFMRRPRAKILLIGVGWNRCSALHTAEALAEPKRLKTRRFKADDGRRARWIETPDVADDLNRLFPRAGAAFEAAGHVAFGRLGAAEARLCGFEALVSFGSEWIGAALARGDGW